MGATVHVDADTNELTILGALRAAARTFSDDFVRFVAGNLAWLVVVGLALLAGRLYTPGYALLLLVVAASLGLCRMSARVVRGRPARLGALKTGVTQRGWSGFGLGCLQLVLLATACTNVIIAVQAPSIPLVLSALVSGYIGLFVAATVLVMWPLMVDPRRQHLPTGEVVRIGLVVIAARPGRHLGLVIVEATLVAIGLQTFVAALVLPAFGLSVASWIALPLADALDPGGVTDSAA